ncbi:MULTISPECIES: DUF6541 family protein [unclassified Pseudonocardia]|jgi:hypothetical protein|uniref:DUF6541 family protein n=1 Tax=unclassified Pseudonocardia TaxID=2619320 RepID=UPI00095AA374|nr:MULTISPECIES: DUF6541 family protein [unclassified Pseudonocardia]MBN9101504.1 hypothetical protein [Pseudonocardia sp.]OJY47375.1 MAG: hypothetical protein BGP03_30180 [Pseudonocardia sp. 73-21]
MSIPDVTPADVGVIATYVVALLLPGGLLGVLSGLRGWTLVATAPLFTYAIAGLAGPFSSELGVKWSPLTFALATLVLCVVVGGVRFLLRRRRGEPAEPVVPAWARTAQLGVVVSVVVAVGVGVAAVLGGIRQLGAIPQDWDAAFHANGIRLIADTGDGGLYAMGTTNWYENDVTVFYPNAYHLVAAAVYQLTGASIPTVLNAHTVLIPGLLALSLAAMVRRFGGRPLLAAATALASVSITSIYDNLWRGPLLPFATGVALTPLLLVLVLDVLDARGLRATVRPALLFAAGLAALLCLHPAILIGAVLFSLPALVQRWWTRPSAVPREVAVLVVPGVLAAAVCFLQVAGTLSSGASITTVTWPADLTMPEALGQILTFSHNAPTAQIRLSLVLVVGLIGYRRLGNLRWVAATAAIFGVLFVLAASNDAHWVKTITSLWWNDRYRLIALTAVPLCVIIGHGVAEAQRWLAALLVRITARRLVFATALVTSVAAILAFGYVTRGLYIGRDQLQMTKNSGDGPAVSPLEIQGMQAIAKIVPPGERVLNDRGDGSVWLYALTGVKPVAAHYDATRTGPDANLLADRFNQYPTDPAVQAAVAQLDIRYVMLDAGFLRSYASREPGLVSLAGQPWLTKVYSNPDVVLYEINDAPAPAGPAQPALAEGNR